MRPNFEEPLDTAKQLVEQNITLYDLPGSEWFKQFLLESTIPDYKILGERFIVADTWNQYWNMSEYDVLSAGTHANWAPYITTTELDMGRWHRSKETFQEDPYVGFLSNKKWYLNEVITQTQ